MIANTVVFYNCPRCGQACSMSAPFGTSWEAKTKCCGVYIAYVQSDATAATVGDAKLRRAGTSVSVASTAAVARPLPAPEVEEVRSQDAPLQVARRLPMHERGLPLR